MIHMSKRPFDVHIYQVVRSAFHNAQLKRLECEDKPDTGKAVVRVAAVEIPIDHLLDIGPPETVLPGKILLIDPDKGFKVVFHAAVIIG